MGLPTEPDPPGNDCLCCWPEGQTPSIVYISFEGLESCNKAPGIIPPPFNGNVQLSQQEESPCNFLHEFDNFTFTYFSCEGGNTSCHQLYWFEEMFFDFTDSDCDIALTNILDCVAEHIHAQGGYASVAWNLGPTDHSIGSLLNSINMEPHAKTKFDFWPASEERMVVRFARKSDATNILILVEPTEL